MELALNIAATIATGIALSPWWESAMAKRSFGDRRLRALTIVTGLTIFILGGIWL